MKGIYTGGRGGGECGAGSLSLPLSLWQLGPHEGSASRNHHTSQALDPKVGLTYSRPTKPPQMTPEVKKSPRSQLVWAQHQQFWFLLGQGYGGLGSQASVPSSTPLGSGNRPTSQTQDRAWRP